jgi:RNA polymerase sigma-70 factor, ECF subfamily
MADQRPAAAPPGTPGTPPSDRSLLRRLREGQEDGATQLYVRYVQRLRDLVRARCSAKLAARVDADDIVQSAFRSFFRVAHTGVYQVPDGEDLWKLLLTITLNKIRAQGVYHNAAKRDVRQTTSLSGAGGLEVSDPRDDLADNFLRLVLAEALEQLSDQHRAVVELRLQGHDVAAIAGQTGRAKRTVERLLQQALAQLRQHFQQDE